MTKPTMELVEEFGFIRYRAGCVGHKSHEELNATSAALLSEIRQRLEAMERDAARYRWLESLFKGFDHDWKLADDEPGQSVLLFNYPEGFRVGAHLGPCIDEEIGAIKTVAESGAPRDSEAGAKEFFAYEEAVARGDDVAAMQHYENTRRILGAALARSDARMKLNGHKYRCSHGKTEGCADCAAIDAAMAEGEG